MKREYVGVALVAALVRVAAAESPNLLANPGFEEPLEKAFYWGGFSNETGQMERVSDVSFEGRHSLRVCGKDPLFQSSSRAYAPVKTNTVYTLSCCIRTENAVARVGGLRLDADGRQMGNNNYWPPSVSGTRGWTRVQTTFNTGETRFIRPIVGIYGKRGTAWFDDFQLREGLPSERVNLIRNSSFRKCATPGYPDFWGLSQGDVMNVRDWETGGYFGVTDREASPVSGTAVLAMRAPGARMVSTMDFAVAADVPLLFSAYLKAEREGHEAVLNGTVCRLTRAWRRFAVRVTPRSSRTRVWIGNRSETGTLFVAAPLLEPGTATNDWCASIIESDPVWAPVHPEQAAANTAELNLARLAAADECFPEPAAAARQDPVRLVSPRILGNRFFALAVLERADGAAYVAELKANGQTWERPLLANATRVPLTFDGLPDLAPDEEVALRVRDPKQAKPVAVLERRAMHLADRDPAAELQIFPEFNWYPSGQGEARVRVVSTIPAPHTVSVTLDGKEVRSLEFPGANILVFTLPVRGTEGTQRLAAEARAGGQTWAYAAETIRVFGPAPHSATRVNRFTRTLEWGGAPVLPMLFHPIASRMTPDWIYPVLKKDSYTGIEVIMPPEMRDRSQAQVSRILEDCTAHGMTALTRFNLRDPKTGKAFREWAPLEAQVRETVSTVSRYANVLGYYLIDEPSQAHWEKDVGFRESDLTRLAEITRSVDPRRPTGINYTEGGFTPGRPAYGGFAAMDFMIYDCYPFLDGGMQKLDPMEHFARIALRFNRGVAPIGMPVVCWLQTYGYGDASRQPTPDEFENMVCTSLIHGTRALVYFIDYPVSIPLIRRIREVQARVAAATPFLLDPLARRVAVSRGNIHAAAYELEGETLVMAANTSDHCAGALTFGGRAADLPLAPNQSGFYRVRHGVWTAR
ncbi:MAG: hypothetical protein RBT78_13470 [Kiritimatiellia bacterium]|jgi:hypothetical protein|nr:hypothetical protein [Kiritimatiellia bacterium]